MQHELLPHQTLLCCSLGRMSAGAELHLRGQPPSETCGSTFVLCESGVCFPQLVLAALGLALVDLSSSILIGAQRVQVLTWLVVLLAAESCSPCSWCLGSMESAQLPLRFVVDPAGKQAQVNRTSRGCDWKIPFWTLAYPAWLPPAAHSKPD